MIITFLTSGVKLILDIGVLDVTTCEPLPDAFVEIWSGKPIALISPTMHSLIWSSTTANATGVYGSYAATLGGGGPSGGAPDNSSTPAFPSESFTDSVPPTAAPSGTGAPGGGDPGSMASSPLERNETFCRGGYATNTNGMVEFTTIYPGFYESRTAHIHTMVHLNWAQSENG